MLLFLGYLLILVLTVWAYRNVLRLRNYMPLPDAFQVNADPEGLSCIVSVVELDQAVTRETVKHTLLQHFAHHHVFTHRIHSSALLWPYFCTAEESKRTFNIDDHIHDVALPLASKQRKPENSPSEAVRDYISNLQNKGIGYTRPPWDLHLLQSEGSGTVAAFRFHHSIGDGVALMRLCYPMLVPNKEMISTTKMVDQRSKAKTSKVAYLGLVPSFISAARDVLLQPTDVTSSLRPATPMQESVSTFLGGSGIELAPLKKVARATGTSINDVVMCAFSGACRELLSRNSEDCRTRRLQCVMWVALRSLDPTLPVAYGNRIGAAYLHLPISLNDPMERLRETARLTSGLKSSLQPAVVAGMINAMGFLPPFMTSAVVDALGMKASVSFSNVPGPQHVLQFAGAAVKKVYVFTRPIGKLGVFFVLISHDGKLTLTSTSNSVLFNSEDLQKFIGEFEKQVESLVKATN